MNNVKWSDFFVEHQTKYFSHLKMDHFQLEDRTLLISTTVKMTFLKSEKCSYVRSMYPKQRENVKKERRLEKLVKPLPKNGSSCAWTFSKEHFCRQIISSKITSFEMCPDSWNILKRDTKFTKNSIVIDDFYNVSQ